MSCNLFLSTTVNLLESQPADSGPFISQSDHTDLQAQIGTDSQECNITDDDLHCFVLF